MTKKRKGYRTSDGMFEEIIDANTSAELAGKIGRNLWRRGLEMVSISRRIQREEAEASSRRSVLLDNATNIVIPNASTIRSRIMRRGKRGSQCEE